MHHRSFRTGQRGAAALASAVLTAGVALATAVPASAHATHKRAAATGKSVTVVEHAITDTEVPLAPGGKDKAGDILVFHNPVFNSTDKRQVGHDEGFCTRINVKAGIWECMWTTFLKGGQLTVQGPYYDHKNSSLSITGGSGVFAGAHGVMGLAAKDGGKKYVFRFVIRH
jgi:allene oxide cyclase